MKKINRKLEMLKKVNNLFKTEDVKISKPIIMIMKLIHILYSFDMGGFNIRTKKMKRIIKFLSIAKCLLVGIITVVTMHISHKNITSAWYYIQIGHNVIGTLIFAYFDSGMTYCDYQKVLLKFDTALRINRKKQYLDIKMFIFAITGVTLRLSFVNVYCFFFDQFCVKPLLPRHLSIFVFISFDLILIVYFFIFYTTYWRLCSIVSIIENSSISIVYLQYLYKGLIDAIETVKSAFDAVFILILLHHGPGLMASIYGSLKALRAQNGMIIPGMSVGYVTNLYSVFLMFLPPLCGGLLSWRSDDIKVALHNRLLLETDKNTYSDIKRFISYVEARPFKLRAWRIIPLDTSLPVHALNIFITYLIVIVQFTHLY